MDGWTTTDPGARWHDDVAADRLTRCWYRRTQHPDTPLMRARQGVAAHGNEISPALHDLALGEPVHDHLLGPDPPTGGGDAAEGSGVRPPADQSGGDRVLLHHQGLQLPAVVREGRSHRLEPLDVAGQSADGPRTLAHLLGDELGHPVEAVLVAAA